MLWSDASASDRDRREVQAETRRSQQARTARTAEATTVSRGDFIVENESSVLVRGGGNVNVSDGGGVEIRDGGRLATLYPSGRTALVMGNVSNISDGGSQGYGLLIQSDGSNPVEQRDVFRAREHPTGGRQVLVGEATTPGADGAVDWYSVWSSLCQIRAYEHMYVETFDGADMDINSDHDLALAADHDMVLSADNFLEANCLNGNIESTAGAEAKFGGLTGTFLGPEAGSGTANLRMDTSTGRITWVSSTERVKDDIRDLEVDSAAVLQLRPRTWLPGTVERQCPDWAHAAHGEEPCHAGEEIPPPTDAPREVGFVAEELDALGLGVLVEYDAEGLPVSIRYDRMTAALVPVIQAQQAQIDALTARLDALETPEEEA